MSGGALGVDFQASALALAHHPDARALWVVIPTPLPLHGQHYRARARQGVIRAQQAESLIAQLERLAELGRLEEMAFSTVNKQPYYARNSRVLQLASALLAFQVNQSAGTGDTIEKARARGLPVRLFQYQT